MRRESEEAKRRRGEELGRRGDEEARRRGGEFACPTSLFLAPPFFASCLLVSQILQLPAFQVFYEAISRQIQIERGN
jgi:hypothetical protein